MLLERINDLTKEKKWSRRELERKAGISVGSITKWKTVNPTQVNLKKVADALGVSVAYLTGESEFRTEKDAIIHRWNSQMNKDLPDEVRKIEEGIMIPIYENAEDEINDVLYFEEISGRLAKEGKHIGIKVHSKNNSPRIDVNDILIVRKQDNAETGDMVVMKIGESTEALCVKLLKTNDGIMLQSFNASYVPIYFSNEEVIKNGIKIIGKVIANVQKF